MSGCHGRESQGRRKGEGEGASYEWHHRVGTRRIRQVPCGVVGRMGGKVDTGRKVAVQIRVELGEKKRWK